MINRSDCLDEDVQLMQMRFAMDWSVYYPCENCDGMHRLIGVDGISSAVIGRILSENKPFQSFGELEELQCQ